MTGHFVSLNCTSISSTCLVENTIYGYYPSLGFNAFFAAFFLIAALAHVFLGFKAKRYFFAVVLSAGCLTEAIGYSGRIIMHSNPYNGLGFKMQISCIIFAPALVAAGIYLNLRALILTIGESTSPIPARYYTPIFMTCDLISLILQAIGGGLSAGAGSNTKLTNVGANIMIAGVVFQVVTLIVFAILVSNYVIRTRSQRNNMSPEAKSLMGKNQFKGFLAALTIAFFAISTRCLYRIAEMAGGWANPIMRNQAEFIVLDGFMIVIAVLALTLFHPGYNLPETVPTSSAGSIEMALGSK